MRKNISYSTCILVITIIFGLGLFGCQSKNQKIVVGVLNYVPALDPSFIGFQAGMTEFGYIEGEDIIYIYEGAAGSIEELPVIAQNLIDADVDLILALSTPAAIAAKNATIDNPIPVVFAPVTDPVEAKILENLGKPEGNITGVSNFGSELRRMEWLLVLTGGEAETIYVPYNPDDPSAASALTIAYEAAEELGVRLVERKATTREEMEIALAEIPEDADAIFMLPDGLAINNIGVFVATADQLDLPFAGPTTAQVEQGALLAFGIDLYEVGKQVARLADQILRGVPPSSLPVEIGKFFLAINLETAENINLEIQDDVLNQASFICLADPTNQSLGICPEK